MKHSFVLERQIFRAVKKKETGKEHTQDKKKSGMNTDKEIREVIA